MTRTFNLSYLCSHYRPNLHLSVRTPTTLDNLSSLVTGEDNSSGKHFGGSTIIYCPTRASVEEVADFLARKCFTLNTFQFSLFLF